MKDKQLRRILKQAKIISSENYPDVSWELNTRNSNIDHYIPMLQNQVSELYKLIGAIADAVGLKYVPKFTQEAHYEKK